MRVFLILSFVFIFSFVPAHAQDDALPDTTGGTVSDVSESPESGNIFDQASAADQNEARRFLKYCSENETLSRQKDCKCAAVSYLETRIKLGAEATPKQIMDQTRNSCLLNPKDAISEEDKINIDKYSEKDIEEAEEAYAFCKSNRAYNIAYDCECFASKFLEMRHENGPLYPKEDIYINMKLHCRNVVNSTGVEYSMCMTSSTFRNTNGIEQKKFCECYARHWANSYKTYSGVIDTNSRRHFKGLARAHCKRHENYK